MRKYLNRSNKATIAGYITAVFNALVVLDLDVLNYSMPSTYVKLFGAIVLPIIAGHATEVKKVN